MKIIEVEYSRLVSEPMEFGNKKVGVRASVAENETPDLVLLRLKEWVDDQLQVKDQLKLTMEDKHKITIEVLRGVFGKDLIPF